MRAQSLQLKNIEHLNLLCADLKLSYWSKKLNGNS